MFDLIYFWYAYIDIIDQSRKQLVNMIASADNRDDNLNEFNLLKVRQATYSHFEQEYKTMLRKEQDLMIKKNMLSRDSLATTSNWLRAMSSEQRNRLIESWNKAAENNNALF